VRAATSRPKAARARPQNMVKVSMRTVKVTLTALTFCFLSMTSISLLLSLQAKMCFFFLVTAALSEAFKAKIQRQFEHNEGDLIPLSFL